MIRSWLFYSLIYEVSHWRSFGYFYHQYGLLIKKIRTELKRRFYELIVKTLLKILDKFYSKFSKLISKKQNPKDLIFTLKESLLLINTLLCNLNSQSMNFHPEEGKIKLIKKILQKEKAIEPTKGKSFLASILEACEKVDEDDQIEEDKELKKAQSLTITIALKSINSNNSTPIEREKKNIELSETSQKIHDIAGQIQAQRNQNCYDLGYIFNIVLIFLKLKECQKTKSISLS